MLTHSRITTIVPVVDVTRARRFYETQLGLPSGEARPDGGVRYQVEGTELLLSPRKEPANNPYTTVSFEVTDVAREVRDLEGRGVRFEDYDLPDLKTVGHVCVLGDEKAAWFKDPDGNVLCVHEDTSRARH
jgi:catechol 2,3-dioxygenase-like lactoylglutathione lyase family enzyme